MSPPWAEPETRFASRLRPANGCLLWTGTLTRGGYGQIRVGGRLVYVHRFAWERVNGPVPSGLELDHLCRNRTCVNPDHLEAVTRQVNTLRGVSFAASNARKTHCPFGHEYTPDNTYVNPKGSRVCRTCKNARHRADRARAKAESTFWRRWVG